MVVTPLPVGASIGRLMVIAVALLSTVPPPAYTFTRSILPLVMNAAPRLVLVALIVPPLKLRRAVAFALVAATSLTVSVPLARRLTMPKVPAVLLPARFNPLPAKVPDATLDGTPVILAVPAPPPRLTTA